MESNLEPKSENKLSTPVAIIFAGILIAGAVLYTGQTEGVAVNTGTEQNNNQPSLNLDKMRKVSSDDHIRGNRDAEVTIVEYSDTECPFCKQFHATMKQAVAEYGDKIAWVYRHAPIHQLHPNAGKEAEALECAAELGGNEKFWAYTDRLYEITPANNGLNLAELPQIAAFVGLDTTQFTACLDSGKYKDKVEADLANGIATAASPNDFGTPWSIVIGKSGKLLPLSGAMPYASVKQIIDTALKN